jgi:hypothetical protein
VTKRRGRPTDTAAQIWCRTVSGGWRSVHVGDEEDGRVGERFLGNHCLQTLTFCATS